MIKNLPANAGDEGSILGSGRYPGEGNGNPFQCSCLENPMDRGDLQAIVHDIAKSQTGLSNWAHTQLHPQWHFQLKPNQKTLEIREESALKKKKKIFFKGCFPRWYFWLKRFWQFLLHARIIGLAMCSLPSQHRILSVSGNQPFWISVVSALLLLTCWSPGKEWIKRSETKSVRLVKVLR